MTMKVENVGVVASSHIIKVKLLNLFLNFK